MISSDVSGPDQAFLTEFCKQFSPLEYSCLHEHLLKADFASHTKDTEQITSFFDTHCGPFPELANKVDLRAWLKKISPKDSDLKSSLYIFSKFLSTAAQSKPEDQSLIDFYQEVIDVTQPADGVMTT